MTASKIAKFIDSIESDEITLRQRILDRESSSVFRLINNEISLQADDSEQPEIDIIEEQKIEEKSNKDSSYNGIKNFQIYEKF